MGLGLVIAQFIVKSSKAIMILIFFVLLAVFVLELFGAKFLELIVG
jgi:hypothetical protein